MSDIAPSELRARMAADDDLVVLDVRRAAAYEEWHVPGSTNIDVYEELQHDPEAARDSLTTIPEDSDVVVVRPAGPVAERAAEQLQEMGYQAETLGCTRP